MLVLQFYLGDVMYVIKCEKIKEVAQIFKRMRQAVGNEVEICIGTHGQLTTYSAIRIAKELEEYSPLWFEEPVAPENVDEMARVAAHTSIPIATGERLVTKYEFVHREGSRFRCGNSWRNKRELRPFKRPTRRLMPNWGSTSQRRCTWSDTTSNSMSSDRSSCAVWSKISFKRVST